MVEKDGQGRRLAGDPLAGLDADRLKGLLGEAWERPPAPTPEERPTYVGLGTTLLAPVAFAAPIGAGFLVDAVGMRPMFLAAAAAGALALGVLLTCTEDPRRARVRPLLGEASP